MIKIIDNNYYSKSSCLQIYQTFLFLYVESLGNISDNTPTTTDAIGISCCSLIAIYWQLLIFLQNWSFFLELRFSAFGPKLFPIHSYYSIHFSHAFLVPPMTLEFFEKANLLDVLWSGVSFESLRHLCFEHLRYVLVSSLLERAVMGMSAESTEFFGCPLRYA